MKKTNLVLFLVLGLSLTSVIEANRCFEPKKVGPCKARKPRFYYNYYSGMCQFFYWGGCQANGNNFETLVECQQTCENPCYAPKKVGPCKARKPRYYYNKYTKQCTFFYWGGCQPNGNNFETLEKCQQTCENPCDAPKKVGPCEAAIERYYYNKYTKQCKFFYWGGCQPNGNNFETLENCQQRCKDPCDQPKKIGPCRGSFPRFYYNKYSKRCELFYWGGCKPNGNNFVTKRDCIKKCRLK